MPSALPESRSGSQQLPRRRRSVRLARTEVSGDAGFPDRVIERRVYQATRRVCLQALHLSSRACLSSRTRLSSRAWLFGGLVWGCTETAPALSPGAASNAAGLKAPAPLTHVTYTSSRAGRTLNLDNRLPLFDRVGFSSPSAILYDKARDLYWVSNLNLDGPGGAGFISRLQPDGKLSTLNFIDGSRPGVELRAPHGLAVLGKSLYVADVTAIRKFNADTGAPESKIEIPGARYLSDVAAATDGSLFATDAGGDPNLIGAPSSGADAVYQLTPSGEVSVVARRADLGGPFAILADEKGLWVTCTGSSELLLLVPSATGGPSTDAGRLPLPGGSPRGIAAMPDGTLLISSFGRRAVYRGYRDGPFEPILTGLETPADLDYDTRRKRLLVPLLTGQAVAVFDLPLLPSVGKGQSGVGASKH